MHVYHTRRAVIRPAHKWIVLFARADWQARWLAKYYSWLSNDVTKIHTPKSQGLLRFYHHLAKYLLKINVRASFQRDIVFHFENIALSNFASLLRVTLIWQPRRPSHTLKNNFIAWYYALWMVKVLENVFRGIICSFAVNNWSNLWRYLKPDVRIISGRHICAPRRSTNRVGRNRRPKT